jgi:hypothetical protein
MIIVEEITRRKRHCFDCGCALPRKSMCARIYGSRSKTRSYCPDCMVKATIKLLKFIQKPLVAKDSQLLKEHIVEVTV